MVKFSVYLNRHVFVMLDIVRLDNVTKSSKIETIVATKKIQPIRRVVISSGELKCKNNKRIGTLTETLPWNEQHSHSNVVL